MHRNIAAGCRQKGRQACVAYSPGIRGRTEYALHSLQDSECNNARDCVGTSRRGSLSGLCAGVQYRMYGLEPTRTRAFLVT
jgi:hypothetical protein